MIERMNDDPLELLRARCLVLPETTERLSHGAPAWFVREKRSFAVFADPRHDPREEGRPALWCAAPIGVQEEMIAGDPQRFFRPPYVGHRGWLGVRLEPTTDWAEITEFVTDAYRVSAPKGLVAKLMQG